MKKKKLFVLTILILVLWPILDKLLLNASFNLPIFRYIIYFVGAVCLFNVYKSSYKTIGSLKGIPMLMMRFVLLWLVLCFVINVWDVFNPRDNYINLKSFFSGQFILFFSFYIANITFPLSYLRIVLKISYYLSCLFLLISIPLFSYFAADITNDAEYYVRNFYLGAVFLLLLFPYQKVKPNLILAVGFLIAITLMLLIARRNVVLYMSSSILFLSLVIIFSKSLILKRRKNILIFGSVIFCIISLAFIFIMEFKFDLFFERASTGMDSRERVIEDFHEDFDAKPLDWLIGRGIFGTVSSEQLGGETGERNLIENGYYYYILKQGLFFLIPFVFLSIVAAYNGFFRSKNHLAKAAAILVTVNLIDMIGYGLPFLGLKHLNLLIAFGFCFSPYIRSLDDYSIREYIRL